MKTYVEREIFPYLLKHLEKKEITLLVGPRQAGKTTLLLKLQEFLKEKNQKTVFFNLDFEEQKTYFNKQLDLINYLKLQFGEEKGYVFIDEIQRLEDAGLFLKGVYDRELPFKLIVSGSGSLELKEKIHESLAGRKKIFEIHTLNFREFVNFKSDYQYKDRLGDFFRYDKANPEQLLREYLIFGGYPRIVLTKKVEEKKDVIKDIYQSYLEKDIQELIKVEKKESFTKLVTFLSSQTGQLISYAELSRTLAIDQETVKKYLWYLEKTFILKKITPFFKNPRKELSKMPLYYFNDLGLRNYSLNQWLATDVERNYGFLFQNFAYLLLKDSPKFKDAKINYWRTKDEAEVDFIISLGARVIPIEVKTSVLKDHRQTKSLRNFMLRYRPTEAFILNKNMKNEIKSEGMPIQIIPYWNFL